LIESFVMRKRIFRAVSSSEGAASRAAESGYRGLSTTAVTVDDVPHFDISRASCISLSQIPRRPDARDGAATTVNARSV
jgi:hypothetical protein